MDSALLQEPQFQANSRQFLWSPESDARCRFLIQEGTDVIVEKLHEECDERMLGILLAGSVMTALVAQRGLTPIHAAVLERDGRAAMIAARRGRGKSTLAAELWRRGWSLLADDLCAIDTTDVARPLAMPGYPRFKLYGDSLERIGISSAGLERVHPTVEKFYLPADDRYQTKSTPLHAIYFLAENDVPGPELQALCPRDSFRELRGHLRFDFSWARLVWPWMFEALGTVADRAPAAVIHRSADGCPPAVLADLLEADFCA